MSRGTHQLLGKKEQGDRTVLPISFGRQTKHARVSSLFSFSRSLLSLALPSPPPPPPHSLPLLLVIALTEWCDGSLSVCVCVCVCTSTFNVFFRENELPSNPLLAIQHPNKRTCTVLSRWSNTEEDINDRPRQEFKRETGACVCVCVCVRSGGMEQP